MHFIGEASLSPFNLNGGGIDFCFILARASKKDTFSTFALVDQQVLLAKSLEIVVIIGLREMAR